MLPALLFSMASFVGGQAVPVPPAPPAVVVAAPAPVAADVPVVIADAAVTTPTAPAARPGHYDCAGDSNETAVCVRDEAQPELPASPLGDQPGQTLGSVDPAYGADLTGQWCAVRPYLCDEPSDG